MRRFLYLPAITSASSITFSEHFDTEEEFLAHLRGTGRSDSENQLQALSEKFASLRKLSMQLGLEGEFAIPSFGEEDDEEDEEDEIEEIKSKSSSRAKPKATPPKKTPPRKK